MWSPCGFWVGWQVGLGKTSLLEMPCEGFSLAGGGWGQWGWRLLCRRGESFVCIHACSVSLFLVSLSGSLGLCYCLCLSVCLCPCLCLLIWVSLCLSLPRCPPSPLFSFLYHLSLPPFLWLPPAPLFLFFLSSSFLHQCLLLSLSLCVTVEACERHLLGWRDSQFQT